jgi:hypothetical protein
LKNTDSLFTLQKQRAIVGAWGIAALRTLVSGPQKTFLS